MLVMNNPMPKLKMTLRNLDTIRRERCFVIEGVTSAASDFKTSNTPPTEGYVPFTRAAGAHQHAWIHAEFDTPPAEEGVDYYLNIETSIKGWDATGPQSLVFLNGKVAFGHDVNHRDTLVDPSTHYDMYNYMYNCDHGGFSITHAIVKVYRRVEKLYYDMLVPYEAVKDVYTPLSTEYNVTLRVLEEAANLIDLRAPKSPEFFASVERAIEYMETEYYGKLCSTEGKPKVNCLGHTHIDVEWCWDRFVTMEKIQRSAATVVDLMRSYPHYKFMLSQPELYIYLKNGSPETYEAVKQLAAEGRWEPEGALLVECDCNLVSGESLVRQITMGKRFFREEFGKDSKVLFLPDVFGYSAALPQILKKSGVDYFMTSKISWNDTNTMPHDNFIWQGIDGTEIFSSFIQGQKYTPTPDRRTTYVGNNDSNFIYGTWHRQSDKEYVSTAMNTYGFGDGGGGPTKDMLEKLSRLQRGLPGFPVAVSTFLYDYLVDIEAEFLANAKKLGKTPKWVGELYLEFHRGTYTTMADNKRDNRKMEFALEKCESLAMLDLTEGGTYDAKAFAEAWHKVLHNQFHDILPGSSIKKVYDNTHKDYEELLAEAKSIVDEKLASISAKLDTDGGILVYNALGFARRGAINVDGKTYITDEEIPALGYKVIKCTEHKCGFKASADGVENKFLRAKFNDQGFLTSLYDKKNKREVLSGVGAVPTFYEDHPEVFDAWEIDKDYFTKAYVPTEKAECEIVEDGDRTGVKFSRTYMSSKVSMTYWISDVAQRLDIETYVDWHETHQLMKLVFPLDIHATTATFETQYGHLNRPTHKNTSWDEAKFEVCAHKWVDVSERGYGIAILNDSKYGHSVEGSKVTITCLRSPKHPNPMADIGEHRFTVSILPHKGDIGEGRVVREAYDLNQPLEYRVIAANKGTLPEEYSLAQTSGDDVLIECVKLAECGDGMVIRMYETLGGRANTTLSVGSNWKSATLTNLMEEAIEPLKLKDGKINLAFAPFEIKTVIVK